MTDLETEGALVAAYAHIEQVQKYLTKELESSCSVHVLNALVHSDKVLKYIDVVLGPLLNKRRT